MALILSALSVLNATFVSMRSVNKKIMPTLTRQNESLHVTLNINRYFIKYFIKRDYESVEFFYFFWSFFLDDYHEDMLGQCNFVSCQNYWMQ